MRSKSLTLLISDYKTKINTTITTDPVTPSTSAVITPSNLTLPPVKVRLPKLNLREI